MRTVIAVALCAFALVGKSIAEEEISPANGNVRTMECSAESGCRIACSTDEIRDIIVQDVPYSPPYLAMIDLRYDVAGHVAEIWIPRTSQLIVLGDTSICHLNGFTDIHPAD